MQWFDQISLPAITVIPLLGALFLLFIPDYDAVLRKRVALFIIFVTGIFHFHNSVSLFKGNGMSLDLGAMQPIGLNGEFVLRIDLLSFVGQSYLLLILFLLLYCSLTKNTQTYQFSSKVLFLLGLAAGSLLLRNFGSFLLCQFVIIQALFIFNLHEGGSHRSSSTLAASVFFVFLDLSAYFAWAWRPDLTHWIEPQIISILIFLPSMTRLLVPFVSPWSRLFFANSTAELSVTFLCTSFIAGAVGLARSDLDNSLVSQAATVAAFFGAIISLSDRNPAQFLLRLASIGGALTLFFLSTPSEIEFKTRVLIYCGSLTLLISFALLIQRGMSEELPEKFEKALRSLWYVVLVLLSGVPFVGVGAFLWEIFPIKSIAWILIFSIMTFALYSRIRLPFLTKPIAILTIESVHSRTVVFNLWSCIALIALSTFILQLLFSEAVATK